MKNSIHGNPYLPEYFAIFADSVNSETKLWIRYIDWIKKILNIDQLSGQAIGNYYGIIKYETGVYFPNFVNYNKNLLINNTLPWISGISYMEKLNFSNLETKLITLQGWEDAMERNKKESKKEDENKTPYEILSFRRVVEGKAVGNFFHRTNRGRYHFSLTDDIFSITDGLCDKILYDGGVSLDEMLSHNECVKSRDFIIYRIKRLSDGEIFTVGDKTSEGIIKKIDIYGSIHTESGGFFGCKTPAWKNLMHVIKVKHLNKSYINLKSDGTAESSITLNYKFKTQNKNYVYKKHKGSIFNLLRTPVIIRRGQRKTGVKIQSRRGKSPIVIRHPGYRASAIKG